MNLDRMRARAHESRAASARREQAVRQAAFLQTPLGQSVTQLAESVRRLADAFAQSRTRGY